MLASQQVTLLCAPLMIGEGRMARATRKLFNFFFPVLVHDHQITSLSEKEETVLTDRKEQLRERKKERSIQRRKINGKNHIKNFQLRFHYALMIRSRISPVHIYSATFCSNSLMLQFRLKCRSDLATTRLSFISKLTSSETDPHNGFRDRPCSGNRDGDEIAREI